MSPTPNLSPVSGDTRPREGHLTHAEDTITGRQRDPSPSGVAICTTSIVKAILLNFDGRASIFKLLLDLRGVFLGDAFLNRLRRTFH